MDKAANASPVAAVSLMSNRYRLTLISDVVADTYVKHFQSADCNLHFWIRQSRRAYRTLKHMHTCNNDFRRWPGRFRDDVLRPRQLLIFALLYFLHIRFVLAAICDVLCLRLPTQRIGKVFHSSELTRWMMHESGRCCLCYTT